MMTEAQPIIVCAFYRFVALPDFEALKQPLLRHLLQNEIKGTVLLAHEGINGTVSGSRTAIDSLYAWFDAEPRFANMTTKEATHATQAFKRTKVRLKKEIVTIGIPELDPTQVVGTYVKPQDWNALISDPDVVLIDARNTYEVEAGTFENAIDPRTAAFRDLPAWMDAELDPEKNKKVAMFCTGGIRCEKSTAYLKAKGFEEVYHLEGGILKYLEEVPQTDTMWEGECFVFDERITVDHNLQKGTYADCQACGKVTLTAVEQADPRYVPGVSCPECYKAA